MKQKKEKKRKRENRISQIIFDVLFEKGWGHLRHLTSIYNSKKRGNVSELNLYILKSIYKSSMTYVSNMAQFGK